MLERVRLIAKPMLQALVPLVDDLTRELPDSERYRRLLQAVQTLVPCDAVALLRLDGDCLVPLAVDGRSRAGAFQAASSALSAAVRIAVMLAR